jgi:hypothetical protein
MNKFTIIDDIVKEFGGSRKVELRDRLNALIDLEFEILKIQKNFKEKDALDNQRNILTSDIMKLYGSDYDKCIRIIERLVRGKWYNFLIIPDELHTMFVNQALVKHDFDVKNENGFDYFKIVDI